MNQSKAQGPTASITQWVWLPVQTPPLRRCNQLIACQAQQQETNRENKTMPVEGAWWRGRAYDNDAGILFY